MISFLLQLGGQEVSQPMSLERLHPAERDICGDLALLGLLLPFRCAGDVTLAHLPHFLQQQVTGEHAPALRA